MEARVLKLRAPFLVALFIGLGAIPDGVSAQDVTELSQELETSRSEKVRLSAAVALGRLGDSRGLPALIECLDSDRSAVLRGVCATALGQIGHAKARPALTRALEDPSVAVRKRARRALTRLNDAAPAKPASTKARASQAERGRYQVTPRESARPRVLYVTGSVHKGVPGGIKRGRELVGLLVDDLRLAGVATVARTTEDETLPSGGIALDASVTTFFVRRRGAELELTCEVRITISDAGGRILGTVTGRASTQTRASGHKGVRALRTERELLVGAVQSARARLVERLGELGKR